MLLINSISKIYTLGIMKNLRELLEHEAKDLYSAETQLIDALPKMAQAATDVSLAKAFEAHLEETREHQTRMSGICKILGVNPGSTTCDAMKGLVKEGEKMIKEDASPEARDAGLIACAQRVEHYEIAGYGTAHQYAKQLGLQEIADILATTLEEEKDANEKLNDLAIETINAKAIKKS